MRVYRVEAAEDFEKLFNWLDKGEFDDNSNICGAKLWNANMVKQMLRQRNYAAHEFHIFVLEGDDGEIRGVLFVEGRLPRHDLVAVKTAVNAAFIFARGCGKAEHDALLRGVFEWAYPHGFFRADVWSMDVYAKWLKDFCGKHSQIIDEREHPQLGRIVRQIVDIKGLVESWLS